MNGPTKRESLFYLLTLFLVGFSSCIPIKAIFYGAPDHKDIDRFRFSEIEAGTECFQFQESSDQTIDHLWITDWSSGSPFRVTLNQLALSRPVRNMLIIKNDTILYSFNGLATDDQNLHPSYSIAKSFTSALVGIAIEEGLIKDVRDKAVQYLPELKDVAGAENLRIEHLLNMTSGIEYGLQTDAILYYGNDVRKSLKRLHFKYKPGTYQEYLNVNIQLLGLILEQATGMKPSAYLSEKIWKPIGMCNDAKWTSDKRGNDLTYCCLGATALDYAKFGRLYLNQGVWEGKQIIPHDWCLRSIARDTTEGSSYNYNYAWHIGEKEYGDYMADGMYKQHIYIHPQKKIIIVLLCNKDNKLKAERVRWRNVFRQIVDLL